MKQCPITDWYSTRKLVKINTLDGRYKNGIVDSEKQ
jgi:hypothetical protein